MAKCTRCSRCNRRMRNPDGWNIQVGNGGFIIGHICPGCQTPQENAEATINEATLDYRVDEFGRLLGRSKAGGQPWRV